MRRGGGVCCCKHEFGSLHFPLPITTSTNAEASIRSAAGLIAAPKGVGARRPAASTGMSACTRGGSCTAGAACTGGAAYTTPPTARRGPAAIVATPRAASRRPALASPLSRCFCCSPFCLCHLISIRGRGQTTMTSPSSAPRWHRSLVLGVG